MRDILDMLILAKNKGIRGKYIDVALGKKKIPESLKEVFKLTILKNGRKNYS
jgi:hypothetical protein|tara:strand:- start:1314 stop:1469 length:156 start_codon:yes stop_codon:yes gene_type:complete